MPDTEPPLHPAPDQASGPRPRGASFNARLLLFLVLVWPIKVGGFVLRILFRGRSNPR